MSTVIDFYSGTVTDHRGRSIQDLQTQTFDQLEANHDYIQWLFPLPEVSKFNSHAPTLIADDITAFQSSVTLRQTLNTSFVVMLHFYGLEMTALANTVAIKRGETWSDRSANWLTPHNHNYLRISRILRCLVLLGCEDRSHAFLVCLEHLYETNRRVIGDVTVRYWRNAIRVKG